MNEPSSPAPFDPSHYTAEELDAARLVIHALYRRTAAPEGPFDPSLYSQQELALVVEIASALRRGPSAEIAVTLGARAEWDGCSRARLIQTRTTLHRRADGTSLARTQDAGPLTDWFDCPAPSRCTDPPSLAATTALAGSTFTSHEGVAYACDSGGPARRLTTTYAYHSGGIRGRREEPPDDAVTPGQG